MSKPKILIVGDSFSSEQLSGNVGWPFLLKKDFEITNISSPGIGEYKILEKINSVDLKSYNVLCVSHTSPYRVYSKYNPLYPQDHLYYNSDIIFSDAENKESDIANSIVDYFKYIFDKEYYEFIHNCCCEKIHNSLNNHKTLHITHFDWENLFVFENFVNFYKLWKKNKGYYNHYNKNGNNLVAKDIAEQINNLL